MNYHEPMEHSETGGSRSSRGGCLKGSLIAMAIVLGLIVLTAVLLVFLTAPGKNQISRLKTSETDTAGIEAPRLDHGGAVLDVSQESLSGLIGGALESALSTVPELGYLGVDIRLNDEAVNVITGVEGTIPRLGLHRRGVVEIRAGLGFSPDGLVVIEPRTLRLGRLPLPTGRLFTLTGKSSDFHRASRELQNRGITIRPDHGQILLDPDFLISKTLPGTIVRHLRAVRGSLRISLELPNGLDESLTELLVAVAANEGELMRRLEAAVPAADAAILDEISSILSSPRAVRVRGGSAAADGWVSYIEGDVIGRLPEFESGVPLDFGDRLTMGTRVDCGRDSYAEILLPGGHITRVDAESGLVITKTSAEGSNLTALNLISGKIRVAVSPLGGTESFRVETEKAVMAVRGTDFTVFLERNGTVILRVLDGTVTVNDAVSARADQEVTVKDGVPGNPVDLRPEHRRDIEEEHALRSRPADFTVLSSPTTLTAAVPHVMNAAAIWARMEEDAQWDLQFAINDHVAAHPEIQDAVDEFFRVNDLEGRRSEFEAMFY